MTVLSKPGKKLWPLSSWNAVVMIYLHDVHEMNAKRAGRICLSVRLSAWFNSRAAGRILMKFGMDVMQLGTTINSNFSILYNRLYQHGGRRNLWGGVDTSAVCKRAIQWRVVKDIRKIQNFGKSIIFLCKITTWQLHEKKRWLHQILILRPHAYESSTLSQS
jgi:hypothetical protein